MGLAPAQTELREQIDGALGPLLVDEVADESDETGVAIDADLPAQRGAGGPPVDRHEPVGAAKVRDDPDRPGEAELAHLGGVGGGQADRSIDATRHGAPEPPPRSPPQRRREPEDPLPDEHRPAPTAAEGGHLGRPPAVGEHHVVALLGQEPMEPPGAPRPHHRAQLDLVDERRQAGVRVPVLRPNERQDPIDVAPGVELLGELERDELGTPAVAARDDMKDAHRRIVPRVRCLEMVRNIQESHIRCRYGKKPRILVPWCPMPHPSALPVALVLAAALVLSGCLKTAPTVNPPAVRVVQVPTSIDGTGRTDVSRPFSAFLATVPDGSTIELVPNAQYRMESTWVLPSRRGLTVDGKNAKIFSTTPGDRTRSNIVVQGGSDIVFRNLRVQGANPYAGSALREAYQATKEAQNGFTLQGVHRITLDNVTVTDTYGDFVEVTRQYGADWSENVLITGSHFARNGRQGITLMGARNVVITGNTMSDMARATFDIEPGRGTGWGVEHVVILNNDVSRGRLFFVAAAGHGPANDVTVQGNRLHGMALQVFVQDADGGTRYDWKVLNNTSDLPLTNPHQAAMQFWRVNGVDVHGNYQIFKKGIPMYGVKTYNSCRLALASNSYPNAAAQSLSSGGC